MPPIGQDLAAPWVQTPGFLADRAARLHTAMLATNAVFDSLVASRLFGTDTPKYKQWKAFLHNFGDWYGKSSGTTWLWSATDATLEVYEKGLRDWETWARRAFPGSTDNLPKAPPTFGPGGERGNVPAWAIALAVGAGAYVAYKVLR